MTSDNKPMLVCAWPAYRTKSPFQHTLHDHMNEQFGDVVEFTDYRVGRSWKRRFDIWHMHWPETACDDQANALLAALKALVIVVEVGIAKLRGARVIWTRNDYVSHEGRHPKVERVYVAALERLTDHFVYLSPAQGDLFGAAADRPSSIIPLGLLAPTTRIDRAEAREHLDIDDRTAVLACLGRIQRYKRIPEFVSAFSASADDDARLLVAGNIVHADEQQRMDKALGDERVVSQFGWIDPEAFDSLLIAADVVVLPYEQHLNSGVALAALGAGTRVAATASAALTDLAATVGEDWVRIIDDPFSSKSVTDLFAWARKPSSTAVDAALPMWSEIASETFGLYQQLKRNDPS